MIHFYKLVSGESIVAQQVKKTKTEVVIEMPIQILEVYGDTEDGENAYTFSPWLPFLEDQTVKINKSAVMLAAPVHEEMVVEYEKQIDLYLNGEVEEVIEQPPPDVSKVRSRHRYSIGKISS